MIYCILILLFLALVIVCGRLLFLKKALRESNRELTLIQQDLTQNHVLHLPLPDKDLELLLDTINQSLDSIRKEQQDYARREREFQSQIEAISHDLRTPLTVILGYLKLLQKQEPGTVRSDEAAQMLESVTHKAQAMEKLITQFYDYSRLTANDYEIHLESIDAGRTMREVLADNCLILENAHLNVETHFATHPVLVSADPDALARILSNLLQNVGRYANSYLKLSIEEAEHEVHILFENDTTKMSEKDVPHLFERFYRNDSSRNQGGSGLGLTIAKSLAEQMGGSLEISVLPTASPSDMAENASASSNMACDADCIFVRFTLTLAAE